MIHPEVKAMYWDFMILIILLGVLMIAIGINFWIYAEDLLNPLQRWGGAAMFIVPAVFNSRYIIRAYKGK